MESSGVEIKVRPITLEDLDAVFSIDRKIRGKAKAITYANLTTERVFTIDRHIGRLAKSVSYVDLISGDVSGLLDLGFVTEVEGHVRGFITGRVAQVGEAATEVGVILILGVHPDYQRRGIAGRLVNAICEKFKSKGIKKVGIDVDRRDKDLVNFVEHMGFDVGHLIDYSKAL